MIQKITKLWPIFFITALFFLPQNAFAAEWVSIGFADRNIQTTTVDPSDNQHILVSLGTILDGSYNYYTEDGGSTWLPILFSNGAITNCNNFVINSTLESEVWAGCATGVYHSTDGGKTFDVIERLKSVSGAMVSVAADDTVFVAARTNSLYRSYDGIIWNTLTIPGSTTVPAIFLNKYNENEIYLSQSGGTSGQGLYRSTDQGNNWVLVNNLSPIRNGIGQMVFYSDGKICASAGSGMACSTNNGISWGDFVSPNVAKPYEFQHFYTLKQNFDDETNLLVLAGTWAGADTKIYAYADGEVLPTVYETPQLVSGITISQGVTYLYAVNSTWTKGLWRNDGIAVVPEYLKKHPVIIIPGILGSWYWPLTNKWELDPITGTYDYLYNSFVAAGFTPEVNLFKFPYQWRNDNRETAYLLKEMIDDVKEKSGANKVDIVAHSMGGIVARIYAQSEVYQNDINQIVFVGTPQDGSASSYPMWEAGDMSLVDPKLRTPLSILLKEESLQKGYLVDGVLKYIRNDVPSIYQLLPVYSYIDSYEYPENYPRNEILEALNLSEYKILQRGIKVTNIVGSGIVTPSGVDVINGDFGIYWPHGRAINYYYSDGDGTVLLSSQLGVSGNVIVKSGVRHADLPMMAMNEIMESLGINYSNTELLQLINKYLYIAAYSPVDFYVIAPDGKRLGFNKNGAEFNEIDGAFYTGSDSETEFLAIPNPLPGEYKVVTYGTDTGNYEIEATYADNEMDTSVSSNYTGQTSLGKETDISVELSSDFDVIETAVNDNVAPITTTELNGTEANGYYNTDVVVSLSAVDDESGIKKTEFSTDDLVWQDYSGPITLKIDGENVVYYRSVDKSGNIEVSQSIIVRIDKTAPVVNFNLNEKFFTHWEDAVINYEITDAYSGVNGFAVKLDGEVINYNNIIDLFDQNLGIHKVDYEAIDVAGNITSGVRYFWVIATFDSIRKDIAWLYENDNFKSLGNAISLSANVSVAQIMDTAGIERMAVKKLEQVQLMLDRLFYLNKISAYGYDIITKDIEYLLEGE